MGNVQSASSPTDEPATGRKPLEEPDDIASSTTSSSSSSEEEDPITPRPFVRHRHVIRQPRINNNRAAAAADSLLETTAVRPMEPEDNMQMVADEDGADVSVEDDECRLQLSRSVRAGSCSQLPSIDRQQRPTDQRHPFIMDGIMVKRKQMFSSLRSSYGGYPQRRRPLLLRPSRSSSYSVRPSMSLSNVDRIGINYLEAARLKKQSVQENLAQQLVWPSMATDMEPPPPSIRQQGGCWTTFERGVPTPSLPVSTVTAHHQGNTTSNSCVPSDLFYLNWIRSVLGFIPPYIQVRQGRLHLKLVQG